MSILDKKDEILEAVADLNMDDPEEHQIAVMQRYEDYMREHERAMRIQNSTGLQRLIHIFDANCERKHEEISARLPKGSTVKKLWDGVANIPASPSYYANAAIGVALSPFRAVFKGIAIASGSKVLAPIVPLKVNPRPNEDDLSGPF